MTVVLKEDYVLGLEEYHKFLTAIVEKHYDLGVKYLENYAWGLSSATFYAKTANGDYTAKISDFSEELQKQVELDFSMSEYLRGEIPTVEYIKTRDQAISVKFKDIKGREKLLRITKHLVGISPFDMKYKYLESGISWLKKVHMHTIPPENVIKLPYLTLDNSPKYLLHGDITPNNLLIFFEKVDAVLDFGLSAIGPVEYDLGRLILFSWFRMPSVEFGEILGTACNYYARTIPEFNKTTNRIENWESISINQNLVKHFSAEHCSSYLKDIIKNKSLYPDNNKWQSDYNFVKNKLEIMLRK